MKNQMKQTPAALTLGEYLAAIRGDRRLSLRQVEEATGREISNAYLSQLENDKVKEPSPRMLHTLSKLYGLDYTALMERAGYLKTTDLEVADTQPRAAAFSDMSLTSEEEVELLRYLKFMRSGNVSKR